MARILILIVTTALPFWSTTAWAVHWIDDIDAAKQKARQENRLLLVDFYADWCGPCRAMDAQVWNQPEIAELTAKFICARVNADASRTAMQYYEVKGLPTMFFEDPAHREAYRMVGYRSAEALAAILRPLPADLSGLDSLRSRLEHDKKDERLRVELGDLYGHYGMYLLSNQCYEQELDSDLLEKDAALRDKVTTNLALNKLATYDLDGAKRLLEKCLNEFPKSTYRSQVLRGLAQVAAWQGDPKRAQRYVTLLEKEFPGDPNTVTAQKLMSRAP